MDFTSIQIGQKYGLYLTFGKGDLELIMDNIRHGSKSESKMCQDLPNGVGIRNLSELFPKKYITNQLSVSNVSSYRTSENA